MTLAQTSAMRERYLCDKVTCTWLAALGLAVILAALALIVPPGDTPRLDDRYTLIAAVSLSPAAE